MFIVIEGADASGKCTQSKLLVEKLSVFGETKLYSFPRYETPIGKAILRHLKESISVTEERSISSSDHTIDGTTVHRTAPEDALIFQCMQFADKAAVASEIKQALEGGVSVVTDRWWPSALVYGAADGLSESAHGGFVRAINDVLPQADLNVLIDVTLETSKARRPERRDRYEKDHEKMATIISLYRRLWTVEVMKAAEKNSGGPRWVTVDGNRPAEMVQAEIWSHVELK